jgi:hypothetical protein
MGVFCVVGGGGGAPPRLRTLYRTQAAAKPGPRGGGPVHARPYSPMVRREALPPAAVVLTVSVRSPAKRSR